MVHVDISYGALLEALHKAIQMHNMNLFINFELFNVISLFNPTILRCSTSQETFSSYSVPHPTTNRASNAVVAQIASSLESNVHSFT